MTLSAGMRVGPYGRGSALDAAERNATAGSNGTPTRPPRRGPRQANATVWRCPRSKPAACERPVRT
jgi:hypothetical protein